MHLACVCAFDAWKQASHTVCVFAVVSGRGITLYHTIGLRKHAKIGFTVEGAYKASIMERESQQAKSCSISINSNL